MSRPYVLPLESCSDPALAGGKATGLARLIRLGFPVPPGICLTTEAYRDGVHALGLAPQRAWPRIADAPEAERSRALEELRRSLTDVALPQKVRELLEQALDGLGVASDRLWAVRSSATDEGSAIATCAGIYRTRLGVRREAIPRAVADCWSSLWSKAAVAYRDRLGKTAPPEMAVLLQPMLAPRAAGVAFSRHPVTDQPHVVINAVHGLGEPLASGLVQPDQYVVEVGTDYPSSRLLEGPSEKDRPEQEHRPPALQPSEALALAELVKKVEQALQMPVDLEWAMDDRGIWLLQARAIPSARTALTDLTSVWSRANFKETMPDVPSPLGLSFLEQFMERNIVRPYRELGCTAQPGLSSVRIVNGRPYINVSLFQGFTAQLGGDPTLVTEQMGGENLPLPPLPPRLPWWKLFRAGLIMERRIRRAARLGPAWFAELKRLGETEAGDSVLALPPLERLARLDHLGRRLHEGDLTFAIVAAVSQGLYALGLLLERRAGPDWRALLNASLQGLGDVISAQQILLLHRLADKARREPIVQAYFTAQPFDPSGFRRQLAGTAFLEEFDAFLGEYGHRAVGESDVASPRFSERPEHFLEVIRVHLLESPARQADDILREQESARRQALQEIHRRFGWRVPLRLVFAWWYRRLARYLTLREANRHALMYFTAATRRLLLSLGAHLVERGVLTGPDDVFFLTAEDLQEAVFGIERDWRGLVAGRRAERKRHLGETAPDLLIGLAGPQPDRPAQAGAILAGIAISAGYAEGPVRVLRRPEDMRTVRKGEVLVVPVIDPGLAPLMGLAVGLVVEMGGTLSHGAIIAREYGIPTVANVPGATRLLKDGERVAVDASRGTVSRLNSPWRLAGG
ncbi:MAG: PEP/pyruvate-binding domain-containing protein [Nitrospirota bacterium]